MNPRYPADALLAAATALLRAAGLPEDKAFAVADILVEGDLLGKITFQVNICWR